MTRHEVTAGMNRVILREPRLWRGDRRISGRLLVGETNSLRGWAPFILNEDERYTTKRFDCVYYKAEPLKPEIRLSL